MSSSEELSQARVTDRVPSNADLVVVATDTSRHVTDAIEALELGARCVLLEKPVAGSSQEVGPLLAHPRRSAVRVCAPLRFHEGLRHLRQELAGLPQARCARIVSQSWLPDWRPDRDYRSSYSASPGQGGALLDLVHEIDYALWVFGAPASSVHGATSSIPSPVLGLMVDESADLLWRATDGTDVSIRVDYVTRPSRRSLVVTSAEGAVTWNAIDGTVERTTAAGESRTTAYPGDLDRDLVLSRQLAAVSALLDGNAEPDLLDLDTAVLAVQIGEQIRTTNGYRDPRGVT